MAGDDMKVQLCITLMLLFSSTTQGNFTLPEQGILTVTSNLGDPNYFERETMYLFYSHDLYILQFPYAWRNDTENITFKSFLFEKSSVEKFIRALNFYGFQEYSSPIAENGRFMRINYTQGRSAQLYISDRTYLVYEGGKEKKTYVSTLDSNAAQSLISSLLYEGESYSIKLTKVTYEDGERRAFTKFNNNLRTVRLWTDNFSDKEVVDVIWEPCGCHHDLQDPNFSRYNKSYLYFYLYSDQVLGKEILKEPRTVEESDRDIALLEKDYLTHNRVITPPPTTTPPPTEPPTTVPPTTTPPPTEPPTTLPPTQPPTIPPTPSPRENLFPFSYGLLFGTVAFTIAFLAGENRKKRKTFK
jgi:hypothetical protein